MVVGAIVPESHRSRFSQNRADGAEVDMLRSKSQLEKANDEIIRLKARLYDLLETNGQ